MLPEVQGEKRKDLLSTSFITPVRKAEVYNQVAAEFGIEVNILAVAGEKYDYPSAARTREAYAYTWSTIPLKQIMDLQGIVPGDSVYIQFRYPHQDLGPFYEKAEKILAEQNSQ